MSSNDLDAELVRLIEGLSLDKVEQLSQLVEQKRLDAQKPKMEDFDTFDWPELKGDYTFYNHQKTSISHILRHYKVPHHGIRGGIASVETGLGKSLIGIATCLMTPGTHLIVCERGILTEFMRDVRKFMDFKAFVLHKALGGTELFYSFSSDTVKKNKIVFTTYDTVGDLGKCMGYNVTKAKKEPKRKPKVDHRKARVAEVFFSTEWGSVVLDECQKLGSPRTNMYQAFTHIKTNGWCGLSSTPIRGSPLTLYAQLRLYGFDGDTLDSKVYNKYNLESVTLDIRQKDLGDLGLPGMDTHEVELELGANERKVYEHLQKLARDAYYKYKAKKLTYEAVNGLLVKLRKVANCAHTLVQDQEMPPGALFGQEYLAAEEWVRKVPEAGTHSTKFNAVVQLLKEHVPADDKVLIFSEWTSPLKILQKRLMLEFPGEVPLIYCGDTNKPDLMLHRFRTDPKCRIILMTVGKGGRGLTLTEANHVIVLEPGYTPSNIEQAYGRVHRIGQNKRCKGYLLKMGKTVEDRMMQIQKEKKMAQANIGFSRVTDDLMQALLGLLEEKEAKDTEMKAVEDTA